MATGGVSDLERGTDETFDFLCSVCKEKNKNTEAEKFCSDCNDYYCSACVKFHAEIPALKNHKILDTAQFKLGSSVKFLAVPTEMCKLHKHKPVDMYCRNHDVVACSACMLVQHSVCKDKFYVPDFIKNSSNIPKSTDIAEQLDTITKQLSVLQKTFITENEKLKHSKENSLKQIQKFRKEINECLDQLEKNTVHELDQRYQSLNDKIESALKEIQVSTNEVKAAQDGLKSKTGNIAQTFVSVKTAQAVAGHAKVKSDTIKSRASSTEISFVANQKLRSLLNDIKVLGDITLTDKQLSQPPSHDSLQQGSNTQAIRNTDERQSTSLLKFKVSKKYNINVKSDETTCNISACILDDGTIILSDNTNIKLKRLDPTSFTLKDYCDLPGHPHQVCAISNTEVAVCCWLERLIQFVTVGSTMNNTRQIKTQSGNYFFGLAYADMKLFVSNDYSVYVYNVSGDKLQQFVLSGIGLSRLAVSSDNLNIYVTGSKKGLIILDRKGSSIGRFSGAELKEAYDVCLQKSGNVLVCGRESKNILLFSPDGKLIGQILKSNEHCQAICYDKNNSKLIVGFYKDDKIEVYDISG